MLLTRRIWIERCLRQIYGDQPSDDANITINLVNTWLSPAIGLAAKTNYKDNIVIDGIGYVNGSFYTKFSNISITSDGNFLWKMQLPEIPVGIGANEGISTLELTDTSGRITRPFIPITESQKTFYKDMRPVPNKILYYYQGSFLYAVSTILLNQYTANVIMVSGGDSTDLDSILNVPPDYDPVMIDYIQKQLMIERNVPVDDTNDGRDIVKEV